MPENAFRELADNAPVMIWRTSPDGAGVWFNKAWLDFTGGRIATESGDGWIARVHPDDRSAVLDARKLALDDRSKFSITHRLLSRDGSWRSVLNNGAPFTRGGEFAGYFGTCTDVSEQLETYARLEQAYRERDGLLREIYHRVKNNLQQIDGLITIEAASLTDPAAKDALSALSGRVRSMGLVHQMLLRSKDLAHISARTFIEALCNSIAESSGASRRGIEVQIEAQDCDVDIERAVVKGLIVNELVANCLKHAFPDNRTGRISIRFHRNDDGASIVEVEDDGVGSPVALTPNASGAHIGMTLVRGLASQLGGELQVISSPGSGRLCRIQFGRGN